MLLSMEFILDENQKQYRAGEEKCNKLSIGDLLTLLSHSSVLNVLDYMVKDNRCVLTFCMGRVGCVRGC